MTQRPTNGTPAQIVALCAFYSPLPRADYIPLTMLIGDLFGVAEQHHGVVAVEQRIVDAGITR